MTNERGFVWFPLTVDVSDQVCEAEKDEDGHALNLKGENYFHLP